MMLYVCFYLLFNVLIFIGSLIEDHNNGPPRICHSEEYLGRISYSFIFTTWIFHQRSAGLDDSSAFIKPAQMVWKSKAAMS